MDHQHEEVASTPAESSRRANAGSPCSGNLTPIPADFRTTAEKLDDRFGQFDEMHRHLLNIGFSDTDPMVFDFAWALSLQSGEVAQIYERAAVINDFLYYNDWKLYDRLRVVTELTAQSGDIHELRDEFEQICDCLVHEYRYLSNYHAWSRAAQLVGAIGSSPEEKVERFLALQDSLEDYGWIGNSLTLGYVAVKLAARPGDENELARQLSETERQILPERSHSTIESGVAATHLMDGQIDLSEVKERFWNVCGTYGLHGSMPLEMYAPLVALSQAPGSADDVVRSFHDATARLKNRGQKNNIIARAAAAVSGSSLDIYSESPFHGITRYNNTRDYRIVPQATFILDQPDAIASRYPIRHHRQQTGHTCGAASARMGVQAVTGRMYGERQMADWLGTNFDDGTPLANFTRLRNYLPGVEVLVETGGTHDELRDLLREGYSVILNYKPFGQPHYGVVRSITPKQILLSDPIAGHGTIRALAHMDWSGGYGDTQVKGGYVALRRQPNFDLRNLPGAAPCEVHQRSVRLPGSV